MPNIRRSLFLSPFIQLLTISGEKRPGKGYEKDMALDIWDDMSSPEPKLFDTNIFWRIVAHFYFCFWLLIIRENMIIFYPFPLKMYSTFQFWKINIHIKIRIFCITLSFSLISRYLREIFFFCLKIQFEFWENQRKTFPSIPYFVCFGRKSETSEEKIKSIRVLKNLNQMNSRSFLRMFLYFNESTSISANIVCIPEQIQTERTCC